MKYHRLHDHIYIRTAPEKGIQLISTLEIMIRLLSTFLLLGYILLGTDTLGIGKFEFGRSVVCGLEEVGGGFTNRTYIQSLQYHFYTHIFCLERFH